MPRDNFFCKSNSMPLSVRHIKGKIVPPPILSSLCPVGSKFPFFSYKRYEV